jgi:hypothetical protein
VSGRGLVLRGWSAWAPRVPDEAAWRAWCAAPSADALGRDGQPDVGFVPAMLRRRCTRLARMILHVAFAACAEPERARARSVFASRHGGINDALPLIEQVARGEPISPTRFSHSVHNAPSGLFALAAGNRAASSAVAAMEDTCAAGLIEALGMLERAPEPDASVLLVAADEPLPEAMAGFVAEPAAFAVALWLGRSGPGPRLALELAPGPATRPAWPDALELVRLALGAAPAVALPLGGSVLRLERAPH